LLKARGLIVLGDQFNISEKDRALSSVSLMRRCPVGPQQDKISALKPLEFEVAGVRRFG